MNTLAHPPDSHCKCRPLENALNAFVNIQYLDGTDVRRRRRWRRWQRLPFSGVYRGFNGITGLHRGWCCWWWWLESRAVFWCLLWTLKLNCYLHSWNAWNAFITENTRTDTPLAVCCFLLLFSVDGWFMFRGCVRVCFFISDQIDKRRIRIPTKVSRYTKCNEMLEDRRPKTARHRAQGAQLWGSITQENASATNQLNLYLKDTRARLHQLHPWHHRIPNRLWWVILVRGKLG